MATTHYYVDTASTTGGDGTTSATSGTNRAYNNLQAALTARAAALTTGNFVVIHCNASGGAADSNTGRDLDFSAWSSVVGGYLTVQVDSANRHTGTYNTTKYRLEGGFGSVFSHPPQYTRIIGMQALNTSDDLNLCIFNANGLAGQGCQFLYNIGRFSDKNFTYGTLHFVELVTDNTGDPVIIANNLFYGGVGTHGRAGSTAIDGANTKALVYSNTIIGFGAANDSTSSCIPDGYSKITAINNLVSGWSHFGSPAGTGTDYNATDLATGPGTGTHNRTSQTFTFVDPTGTPKNYQLASGDTGAKGYGKDLSSDGTFPVSDDVTGTTRTTPWDIGAFIAAAPSGDAATGSAGEGEYVAGSGTESQSATAAAGEAQALSGAGTESDSATAAAGEAEAVSGAGTESDAATGTAGSGAALSGGATLVDVATGAAGEGEKIAGSGTESDAASGAAGEGAKLAGTGTESDVATGTMGEGESFAGFTGVPPDSGTGTIGEGEGLAGSGTESDVATGNAGEGETLTGAATEAESATAAAGEGEHAAGIATESESGTMQAAEGEQLSGSATEAIAASGTMAEGEALSGAATVTAPGALIPLRGVITSRARYKATITSRTAYSGVITSIK